MTSSQGNFSVLRDVTGSPLSGGSEASGLKVFVLGGARSGTSILYQAMHRVFDLKGRGEGHVFPLVQGLIHHFYTYALRFAGDSGSLASKLDTASFSTDLYEHIRQLYRQEYPHGSFVDKTPGADAIIGASTIRHVFPEAKIILTRRTGVEVVGSFQRKFLSSFEQACEYWADCADSTLAVRERGTPVLELDQFDMANSPGPTGSRIARFIGEPDRADILARFLATERVEQSSSHDWSRRLTLDETGWSAEQKDVFRRICGPGMARLGYGEV
jgi:hypothetical protein